MAGVALHRGPLVQSEFLHEMLPQELKWGLGEEVGHFEGRIQGEEGGWWSSLSLTFQHLPPEALSRDQPWTPGRGWVCVRLCTPGSQVGLCVSTGDSTASGSFVCPHPPLGLPWACLGLPPRAEGFSQVMLQLL